MKAASQIKNKVRISKLYPKFGEINQNEVAVIWTAVLLLATKLTLIGLIPLLSAKNCLREDITNSLVIIAIEGMKNNKDVAVVYKSQIKTIQINNLSAIKSNKAPIEVEVPVFLAI